MFFFLSKILDVLLQPMVWAMILLLAAVPLRARDARSWRRRRICGLLGLAVLVVFSLGPVANRLLRAVEESGSATFREGKTYDAVVLLGGVTDEVVTAERAQPAYNDNVERLLATFRLLRTGQARFAIVSGAASAPAYEDVGEARWLKSQLVEWGIEPSRVLVEDKARNTHENALYSKSVASEHGFHDVLIVTSAFHGARAVECFAAVDMPVDFLPVDYRAHRRDAEQTSFLPRAHALAISTMAIHEWSGRWIYRLRGYGRAL